MSTFFWKTRKFTDELMYSLIVGLGKIAITFLANIGWWSSLGIHISIKPFEINLHILWFIVGITTVEHALFILDSEEAYDAVSEMRGTWD